jgi:hypothetical protein
LEDLHVTGRIIIKWESKSRMREYGVDLSGSGEKSVFVSITIIFIVPQDAGILLNR